MLRTGVLSAAKRRIEACPEPAEGGDWPPNRSFDTAFGLPFDKLRTWLRMRFGYDLYCVTIFKGAENRVRRR